MANNIADGSQMDHTYKEASALLGRMTKMNRDWHTREADVVSSISTRNLLRKEMRKEKNEDERTAKLITEMELFTNHVMGTQT